MAVATDPEPTEYYVVSEAGGVGAILTGGVNSAAAHALRGSREAQQEDTQMVSEAADRLARLETRDRDISSHPLDDDDVLMGDDGNAEDISSPASAPAGADGSRRVAGMRPVNAVTADTRADSVAPTCARERRSKHVRWVDEEIAPDAQPGADFRVPRFAMSADDAAARGEAPSEQPAREAPSRTTTPARAAKSYAEALQEIPPGVRAALAAQLGVDPQQLRDAMTRVGHAMEVMTDVAAHQRAAMGASARPADTYSDTDDDASARVKSSVNKPPIFDGSCGLDIRTWFHVMSNFLTVRRTPRSDAVAVAVSYLGAQTAVQWYTLSKMLTQQGLNPVDWDTFRRAMVEHYGAVDPEGTARRRLDSLTVQSCDNDLQEYVRKTLDLHAQILTMDEGSKIHRFIQGLGRFRHLLRLDPTTKSHWRNFATLAHYAAKMGPDIMRADPPADNLQRVLRATTTGLQRPFTMKSRKREGPPPRGRGPPAKKSKSQALDPNKWKGTWVASKEDRDLAFKSGLCFLCKRPGHRAVNCPDKAGPAPKG